MSIVKKPNQAIPQVWIDILKMVQTEYPEACLTGGCLRDWLLGKPVKDIDIIVKGSNISEEAHMFTLKQCFPDDNEDLTSLSEGEEEESGYGISANGVSYVFELIYAMTPEQIDFPVTPEELSSRGIRVVSGRDGTVLRDVKAIGDQLFLLDVQIIAVEEEVTLEWAANRNDFGICQTSHNGATDYIPQTFWDDAHNQTFTLIRCTDMVAHSLRFERLEAEKFQGWKADYRD